MYEVVYIFNTAVAEEQINEKLERYHALIAGAEGGEITAVDHWGRRQLAYEVEDQTSGYYVVVQFSTDGERLPEFERILKLDEELLRYMIVINEGDLTTSPVPPQPKRDEDEEGEEEGED